MKLDSTLSERAKSLVQGAKNIVITNHVNPDGDAMGSALGLQIILQAMGKKVQVIAPNEYPNYLKWLKGSEDVLVFDHDVAASTAILNASDLIFHLDYNALKRSGPMEEALRAAMAARVMIDHHQQPEDFALVTYSDPKMSSTCEMIYHFAEALGIEKHINKAAAEALYTGIITDTGNFRFSSTTPETHRVASFLIAQGVEPQVAASKVYDSNRPERLSLLARMLDNMEYLSEYNTVILYLTESDMEEHGYRKGDTEGFVNYGLSLQDVELSIFMYPAQGKVKMSFRSKTNFDVNRFARSHFNGGGHINAAGGMTLDSLQENITKFKNLLPQYADQLSNN